MKTDARPFDDDLPPVIIPGKDEVIVQDLDNLHVPSSLHSKGFVPQCPLCSKNRQ